jgi:hypothetical protein
MFERGGLAGLLFLYHCIVALPFIAKPHVSITMVLDDGG